MNIPKKFMAASVPRYIRQTKLSYLPLNAVIGSHITQGDGNNLIFDVVMLPVQHFARMKSNVGLQHVIAPAPSMGAIQPMFMLKDTKEVVVPADEPDPETYARNYFIKQFKLDAFKE